MSKTKRLVEFLNDVYNNQDTAPLLIVKVDAKKNYAPFGIDIKAPFITIGLLSKVREDIDFDKCFELINKDRYARFFEDSLPDKGIKYSLIVEIRDPEFNILYKRDE